MGVKSDTRARIAAFLGNWEDDSSGMRTCFEELYTCVGDLEQVSCEFVERPGVSYSIRPKYQQQTKRDLFAIIDVIDDVPDQRWLSVCFYEDMISDPENLGEVIPGGLAGGDGYCFDIDTPDQQLTAYLKKRLVEAWSAARDY